MAGQPIATLNDLMAAMAIGDNLRLYKTGSPGEAAGIWSTTLDRTGTPPAMAKPASSINGAVQDKSNPAYIQFRNPTGGRKKYLGSVTYQFNQGGTLQLVDVLWHNWTSTSGIVPTTTTEQAIATPQFPARDINQAALGEGCEIWMTILTTAGTNVAAVTNTTVRYTNSAGVGNRIATLPSFPATPVICSAMPLYLQSGDTGVASIEGITLGTSYGAGEIVLMVVRPIAFLGVTFANAGVNANFADLGLPEIFPDSALAIFALMNGTSSATFAMALRMAEW